MNVSVPENGPNRGTLLHHLPVATYRRGRTCTFKSRIKDPDLAEAVKEIEKDNGVSPEESRKRIREEVEERYTGEA